MLLLLVINRAFAQYNIQFRDITLSQAVELSAKENKPVFFMGFANWCQHCKNMKETVFTDSSVATFYNEHFICIHQDMEEGAGPSLKDRFGVRAFPAFVFLDGTGARIYQVVGELDKKDCLFMASNALNPQKHLNYLQDQFDQNPGDTARAVPLLQALNRAQLPTQEIAQKFFAAKSEKEMLNYPCWRVLNMGVSDITSKEFQFIVDHQKEYGELVSPQRVQRKIFRTTAYNFEQPVNNNDTVRYRQLKKVAVSFHNTRVDSLIFNYDLQLFELSNNWTAYQKEAVQGTQLFEWDDYVQLRHIADIFYKHVTDADALKTAATWAKRSGELKPEYGNTLLCAQLYEKSGNKSEAKKAAQDAVDIATRLSLNHAEADQLLQRVSQQ